MGDYLLDTNHASALLDGIEPIRTRIRKAKGSSFSVSITIVGELYFEAYASQRREANLARLAEFLNRVIILDYDHGAAQEFGLIQAEQKRKGKPIPPVDAQIAAVARIHGLVVLTADRHFGYVGNLVTENWLEG